MTVGRRPKPSHLKLVAGNPGRRPLNASEPKPKPKSPAKKLAAPNHLSDGARAVWPDLKKQIDAMGVLTSADDVALEQLCEAIAQNRKAQTALKNFGSEFYETKNQAGAIMYRAHPAVALIADSDRRIKAWLAEFGLTPSSRTRVHGQETESEKTRADSYF